MIYLIAILALGVVMLLILLRSYIGPTNFDRLLAMNTFGTAAVLAIALLAFFRERPDFIDLALVYALINFIGTIAVLRFWRLRSFADRQDDSQ